MMINRTVGKIARLLVAVTMIAVATLLFAIPAGAYSNGYYIKNYDVNIAVNEDNSYDITETIDVYFDPGAYKHGIIRNIPLVNDIVREDGTTGYTHARVSDIAVNNNYIESKEGDEVSLRIGDAYTTVEGDVQYIIKYKYSLGRDIMGECDEFYFNIIGTEWDTDIESVDFAVTFPKDIGDADPGFVKGGLGSTDYTGIEYKFEGNTVYGSYHEALPAYNGLTMRMELPEGYFVVPETLFERIWKFLAALPIVLAGLVIAAYRKFGSNEKPVEPVEFYPPDDLNSLEIGFIYDGRPDDKDVTSLLIYLANKGYLEIRDLGHSRYDIVPLKESYEGSDEAERLFYEGLLSHEHDGVITENELEDSFYTVVHDIKRLYTKREKRRTIIIPTGKYKVLGIVGGIAAIWLSAFIGIYNSTLMTGASIAASGAVVFFIAFFMPFVKAIISSMRGTGSKVATIIAVFVVGINILVFGGIGVAAAFNLLKGGSSSGGVITIAGIILGMISFWLGMSMNKRTDYGNEMLGRIRGFRNFLETAEKPKLEELVEQDPKYFYNILPYAHVLGVSSKWIAKFDDIASEPPEWYAGNDISDFHTANASISGALTNIGSALTSSPSTSDSGGYSSSSSGGGGSSGGGSGGGGGSSW